MDEILDYQNARYVSSNEAAWRILEFPIYERDPPVQQLSVHLENGQRIYFTEDNALDQASGDPPKTTLTEFFALCHVDNFATYNKLLLRSMNYHCNVELCMSIKSIKYVLKYEKCKHICIPIGNLCKLLMGFLVY